MNNFDTILNKLLEELTDREQRLQALKDLSDIKVYVVHETSTSRGYTDVWGTRHIQDINLETVVERVKSEFLEDIVGDFETEDEYNDYVNDWVSIHYSSDNNMAFILTGEETGIIIISEKSKYYNHSPGDIERDMGEIDNEFVWT